MPGEKSPGITLPTMRAIQTKSDEKEQLLELTLVIE
jgi:hypothetical protein